MVLKDWLSRFGEWICKKCMYAPCTITNADRIRAMSDEDLACRNVRRVWITNSEYGWSEYITSDEERFEDYNVAIKHELEWLQKPA